MRVHQLDSNGTCSTCKAIAKEQDIVECLDCRTKFHADCDNTRPFCSNRAFLDTHIRMSRSSTNNFPFMCDHCLTRREHNEASSLKEQLEAVVQSVATLTKEVKELKTVRATTDTLPSDNAEAEGPRRQNTNHNKNKNRKENNKNENNKKENDANKADDQPLSAWNDKQRTKAMKDTMKKFTVCIKSNDGAAIDTEKVKHIITANGIKVNRATINKKNNDFYVDLPSSEQRDRLIPLLSEDAIPGNEVVSVKEKGPTISIRGVQNYVSEEDLIARIKDQNEGIKEKIEDGSLFSVVFSKEHNVREDSEVKEYQVVVRVSEGIRDVIRANGNKIFIGFNSHRVVDRFYVKSCSRCHKFGHYRAECTSTPCCGYCCATDHESNNCPVHAVKNQTEYKCTNCKEHNKTSDGHSSHWNKCPVFLEIQKKMMQGIPYYAKNGRGSQQGIQP